MTRLFSLRVNETRHSSIQMSDRLRRRLLALLRGRNEPYPYQPDPSDNWTVNSSVLLRAAREYALIHGDEDLYDAWDENKVGASEMAVRSHLQTVAPARLMDVIEKFVDYHDHPEDVAVEINATMREEGCLWVLYDKVFEEARPPIDTPIRERILDIIRIENFAWWGVLDELQFVKRIVNTDKIQASDLRFDSYSDDIIQHRVRNDDWGNNWVLDDSKINLIGCDEKRFVRFIDLLLNPTIQSDKTTTEKLATLINRELNKAGYQIEKSEVRLGAPDRNAAIGTSTTIGVGGFGRVRIAKVNGVVVAIKELLPELRQDEDACGRFAYEIATLKKLKGMPGVVKIIDESVGGDRFAFSMECAQSNLEEYITRNPSLSQITKAALVADVCSSMQDIHKRGVVHRDICPRNVLMFGVNPKITDFGLAMDRERVRGLTRTSARIGKEPYMAPEVQDSLLNATEISDVYALGRLLQFALTTEEPLGEPDQPGVGVFSSIIRHATAPMKSQRIQDPGILASTIRDMVKALTVQDRITSLVEYLASLEGGLAFDAETFHLLVMESSTDDPYESFWDPVIDILDRTRIKNYVEWSKNAQIIDFVRVCQRQYDALPSVGWPFSSANSMTDLVLTAGVTSRNIAGIKLAFEFAWRIGIYGNQFASRDQVIGYLVKEGRAMTDDMVGHVVSVIQRYKVHAKIDDASINRMHPTIKAALRNRMEAADE